MDTESDASGSVFVSKIADAYRHLYDLVGLRTHAIVETLVPDPTLDRKEKAWRTHRLLLDAIEDLNPGRGAPIFSHEWRRHRLLVLRYVDGLDPQAVADQLAISRRQYYREHEAAMEAVAQVISDLRLARSAPLTLPNVPEHLNATSKLELLRLEVARTTQAQRHSCLQDILPGVLTLFESRLRERQIEVFPADLEKIPDLLISTTLLRQLLLGVIGFLLEFGGQSAVRIKVEVQSESAQVELLLRSDGSERAQQSGEVSERVTAWNDLAGLGGASIRLSESDTFGFRIDLPIVSHQSVLLVDDNEDVLELFHHYLTLHHYSVVTETNGEAALDIATWLRPLAIVLDLMMPGMDGWDVLQALLTRPETRDIPVIICSVIREKDLALSLGAAAFIEKPVSEQALLSVIEKLAG